MWVSRLILGVWMVILFMVINQMGQVVLNLL